MQSSPLTGIFIGIIQRVNFFNDMVAEEKKIATAYVSPEEYLVRERAAFERSEYDQGEIIPMAGATRNHNRIKENIIIQAGSQMEATQCQSFSSDMRVYQPEAGLFAYPDIIIVYGEPELADKEFDTLLNPAVIIEVLSEGTERYDRNQKFQRYQKISSLREYILVASQSIDVAVWRKGEDGHWKLAESHTDVDQGLRIDTIDLSISLTKVYARTVGLPV